MAARPAPTPGHEQPGPTTQLEPGPKNTGRVGLVRAGLDFGLFCILSQAWPGYLGSLHEGPTWLGLVFGAGEEARRRPEQRRRCGSEREEEEDEKNHGHIHIRLYSTKYSVLRFLFSSACFYLLKQFYGFLYTCSKDSVFT